MRMIERAEARAVAATAKAAERLAARLGEAMPEAEVRAEGQDVVVTGVRLRGHPALRWPGSLLR